MRAHAAQHGHRSQKEITMPWFMWLLLAVVFGGVIGSLLMLRESAKRLQPSEEALARMKERNAELSAQKKEDD